jgi:hypothetical protein
MCDKISHTIFTPEAIRYRLLKDPFGPLSLAEIILASDGKRGDDWCTKLDVEHRIFLLSEILLATAHLKNTLQTLEKDNKFISQVMNQFDEVREKLMDMIGNEFKRDGTTVPRNLKKYVKEVRKRTEK